MQKLKEDYSIEDQKKKEELKNLGREWHKVRNGCKKNDEYKINTSIPNTHKNMCNMLSNKDAEEETQRINHNNELKMLKSTLTKLVL